MGVAIPQIITEDRASGALIVDGSLRFTGSSYLKRTPGSTGNTTTYTISCWVKRSHLAPDGSGNTNSNSNPIFSAGTNAGSDTDDLQFYKDAGNNNAIRFVAYPGAFRFDLSTSMVFRDVSSWYHILANYDGTTAKIYINGTQVTAFASSTQNGGAGNINTTDQHVIGASCDGSTSVFRGYISQFYFIDGQALTPSYFGYTDGLTNTWRPKKLSSSVAFGTNGFYLPFDGSAPIGQDQSGRGNNWTPVNFGGSNTIEKATGALPILNTDGGGKVARVGVRTDSYYTNLKLAVPFVGVATDVVQQINGNSAAMSSFTANNATFAVHPTDGAPYGTGLYLNSVSDYPNINYAAGTFNFLHNQTGSGTVEFWMYNGAFSTEASMVMGISGSPDVGFGVQMASSTTLQAIISRGVSGSARNSGTANISQNTWSHIAVTKTINGSNAELKLYVNGVLSASNTSITASDLSNSNSTYSYFRIGQNIGDETARGWTNYYMNDLRIYDTVKYTSNFIPASTDPDILPDTPSGVSYSSNLTQITDGAVAFDGSGDYLSLASSADFAFGTGDFTAECFVYPSSNANFRAILDTRASVNDANGWILGIDATDEIYIYSNGYLVRSGAGAVPENRWYHVAYVRSSGTHALYIDGKSVSTSGTSKDFTTQAFRIGATPYDGTENWFGFISNAHIVKGTALYTSNFTPPTGPISSVANTKLLCCQSNSNPKLSPVGPNVGLSTSTRFNTNFESIPTTVNGISVTNNGSVSTTSAGTNSFGFTNGANFTGSNSLTANLGTVPALSTIDLIFKVNGTTDNKYLFGMGANGIVRRSSSNLAWYNGSADQTVYTSPDDGAWHHLRVTPTDLYFDGTRIQNTGSLANINNEGVAGNNPGLMAIGAYRDSSQTTYNGAVIFGLVRVMPGVDLGAPTVPITTNGSLSSSETIPNDGVIIRNGNAAATNFNPFTVNINTQRGKQSGWCTLNPLDIGGGTLSNGNLDHTYNSSNIRVKSTISIPTTGKWYAEFVASNAGGGNSLMGVATAASALTGSNWYLGNDAGSWGLQVGSGTMYTYHNGGFSSFGTANNGDVIAVAVDRAAGKIWWAVNNIWIAGGDPVSGTNARYTNIPSTDGLFFAISNASNSSIACNFGQKPFKFPPPAGFQPLALANTPRPTIVRPDQYVGIVTYYAADAVAGIATGLSFKPDLVWVKSRTSARSNVIVDSVRGTNSVLWTNLTDAQLSSSQYVSQFNSNGFNYGVAGDVTNNSSLVGWCWKAGGNSNTYNINDVGYATAAAAGLTAGTITPTGASVNTKSGFSIITYTGTGSAATISHGGLANLSNGMIIVKNRSSATNWRVYHSAIGNTKTIFLSTTGGTDTSSVYWNNTSPTSTVFSVGSDDGINGSGNSMVAYCWAEIPGFSKFGSYTGNGSADGPMVITGFRPRWIMIKRTDSADDWNIFDTTRSTYNVMGHDLLANRSDAEYTGTYIDSLSNGFKIRETNTSRNASGGTYIYAAFAETPTQNLYGAQANAR